MPISQDTEPSKSNIKSPSSPSGKKSILIKYGGNAMTDENIRQNIIKEIAQLHANGHSIILVHGGGPFIEDELERRNIKSNFFKGHRYTTAEMMEVVQMVLKGSVNSDLVQLLNAHQIKAVGLSGKDALSVTATRRTLQLENETIDLGFVGDIISIDSTFYHLLLKNNYLPVIASVSSGENGEDLNVNADMFAGHLAGAMQVDDYVVLTDVDGLYMDFNEPDTLISNIQLTELEAIEEKVVKGGMIPKVQSCKIAIQQGAKTARIINGTKPGLLTALMKNSMTSGTCISK